MKGSWQANHKKPCSKFGEGRYLKIMTGLCIYLAQMTFSSQIRNLLKFSKSPTNRIYLFNLSTLLMSWVTLLRLSMLLEASSISRALQTWDHPSEIAITKVMDTRQYVHVACSSDLYTEANNRSAERHILELISHKMTWLLCSQTEYDTQRKCNFYVNQCCV